MKDKGRQRMKFETILSEIETGSSRVAIIVCGAVLDELLYAAISFNFIKLSDEQGKDIFEGNGPLATFSGRIKVCYAMGLISKKCEMISTLSDP